MLAALAEKVVQKMSFTRVNPKPVCGSMTTHGGSLFMTNLYLRFYLYVLGYPQGMLAV